MPDLSPQELFEKIISKNDLCILATSSKDGVPEAATIQYTPDFDFNLYFETFPSYRKYANLKSNPRTSIVITKDWNTIQMDGFVKELEGEDAINAKKMIIDKHGEGAGYLSASDVTFFKFTPNWIRILVDGNYPPKYVVLKE